MFIEQVKILPHGFERLKIVSLSQNNEQEEFGASYSSRNLIHLEMATMDTEVFASINQMTGIAVEINGKEHRMRISNGSIEWKQYSAGTQGIIDRPIFRYSGVIDISKRHK